MSGQAVRHSRQRPSFDYACLDAPVQEIARDRAAAIHRQLGSKLVMRSGEDVVLVGLRLIAVRKAVGRKKFQRWVQGEFQWGQPSVSKFMRSALVFQDVDCLASFQPSALYVLSRRSVPLAARTEAISAARAGSLIEKRDAEAIVDRYTGQSSAAREVVRATRAVQCALKQSNAQLDYPTRLAMERLARWLAARLRRCRSANEAKSENIPREYFDEPSRPAHSTKSDAINLPLTTDH